jgi:glycine amidinotransferase
MIEERTLDRTAAVLCPVNSHNEWDPLEEVIVGRLEGANIPSYHASVAFNVPKATLPFFRLASGWRYPPWMLRLAQRELDQFIHILEAEGVRVQRPEPFDFHRSFRTPYWKARGWCAACPRDLFMVVGDDVIETPGSWRSRFFEAYAYRPLFKEYFQQGARWTSAPRPELRDELYDPDYRAPEKGEPLRYLVNETEPVFDAADFVRCGLDLFFTRSNVTNYSGVEWLRRHLGSEYRIHEIPSLCTQPMHIDTTFMPLAPGKVLVNPEYCDVKRLPPVLKSWDVLVAPQPDPFGTANTRVSTVSRWCSINVLMLDQERVVVHESQVSLSKALKDWGFKPIPCSFHNYRPFGGSFHCATLDIRRRGTLQSYF